MLTILIFIILAFSFYTGFRRGLIMQAIQLIGYTLTVILATQYYEPLSEYVEMIIPFPAIQQSSEFVFYNESQSFFLDQAFYRAISFVIITIIGWILTKILSSFLTKIIYYDVFKTINRVIGGLINLFVTYVVVFVVLFIASLIPIEFVQQQFVDNPVAYQIVANTPVLSDLATETWLNVNPLQSN
ncbi:CvpA family protein [Fundicoccus culcitae]|uniref:CvpA family protein n=1 Tax=Fundicoccus culcitae TaxID=2969821 RepID=A0ABY5P7P2_9LACT|nr:CvpA family protein [Fundicoccus culcitae]UUX34615.1 CvpA family protein [Fundicoccus culcitae]